jgi:hypothetical protein
MKQNIKTLVGPWSNENKVSQHPACKDDGILHGKTFGNYFIN